ASLKALPRSIGSPRLMYRKNKNPFCNEKRLERSILVRKMASVKLKLHSFGSKNQLFGEGSMYRKNKNPFCNEKRLGRSILVRKMASVKLKLHSFGSKNQLFGEGSSRNAIRKPSAALLFRTLPPDPRSRGSDQYF